MHYDPQWGSDYFQSPMPADRFIFDARWKYYADGRFYQTSNDPEEQPSLPRGARRRSQALLLSPEKRFSGNGRRPAKRTLYEQAFKGLDIPEPDANCRD